MFLHVLVAFPETSGKTLEEVESMFLAGEKAWKTRVQYRNVREMEAGNVVLDPQKRVSLVQHQEVAGNAGGNLEAAGQVEEVQEKRALDA
jgi:hypothetical protein